MNVHLVKDLPSLERFLYWIQERHAIYLRRQAGQPKPWTDDEVLQRYFFTNPYREHDKTTVWFREHVRDPLRDDPAVLMATVIFRWFNRVSIGELLLREGLLTEWNCSKAVRLLGNAGRVFTGAFNISNGGSTKPKIKRVCEDYVNPIWRDRWSLLKDVESCGSLERAHARLRRYLGMGGSGFMAYEVICDLRYTYLLKRALDKLTWSNPGPGAKRGLNRLLERPLTAFSMHDWPERSAELLRVVRTRLKKMPPFEMREVEHSLCEFDKYERAASGDSRRMKRKFNGLA